MISYLKGTVLEKTNSYLILENQGIGYKLFTTPELLGSAIGNELSVFTYLKTSDDGQSLFGLPDFKTLQFFELLITVSGVGPKVALSIVSSGSLDNLESAISNEDTALFTRIGGVGKKTAERIILELKNKVSATLEPLNTKGASDVYDALLALGYSAKEAKDASINVDFGKSSEEQLKQALGNLRR